MGLRAKLKKTVKKLFFDSKEKNDIQRQSTTSTGHDSIEEDISKPPENHNPTVQKEEESPSPSKEEHTPQDTKTEKAIRHRKRARLGLLRFVLEKEGQVDLATLHTHSEMRYFIGHQSFSTLMEEMVEDGVLDFDWEESQAFLTEKGRSEIDV